MWIFKRIQGFHEFAIPDTAVTLIWKDAFTDENCIINGLKNVDWEYCFSSFVNSTLRHPIQGAAHLMKNYGFADADSKVMAYVSHFDQEDAGMGSFFSITKQSNHG